MRNSAAGDTSVEPPSGVVTVAPAATSTVTPGRTRKKATGSPANSLRNAAEETAKGGDGRRKEKIVLHVVVVVVVPPALSCSGYLLFCYLD